MMCVRVRVNVYGLIHIFREMVMMRFNFLGLLGWIYCSLDAIHVDYHCGISIHLELTSGTTPQSSRT